MRALSVALVGLVCCAPALALGGVYEPVALTLAAAILVAAGVVALRRPPTRDALPFLLPFGVAVGATALQLVPLPPALLEALSPETARTWRVAGFVDARPLSLSPTATSHELVRALVLAGLFLAAASLAQHRRHARALLWILAALGAFEAAVALGHLATDSRAVLGLFEPRFQEFVPIGTFVNKNHAAGLLALALAPMIALGAAGGPRDRFLAGSLALLGLGVVFISGSRSGALAAFVGCAVPALVLTLRAQRRQLALAALLAAGLGAGAMLWFNRDVLARKMGDLDEPLENAKVLAWADAARVAAAFPATGIGRGAYQEVAPRWKTFPAPVRVTHPESWPLQFAAEWGLPVTGLLLVAAGWAAVRRLRAGRLDSTGLGAVSGLVAITVSNLADFNLEFLGTAAPAAVLLGVFAVRRDGGEARVPRAWPAAVFGAGGAALVAHALWAAPATFARVDAVMPTLDPATLARSAAVHPADYRIHLWRGRRSHARAPVEAALEYERAAFFDPWHPAPHVALARLHARAGRRALAAIAYRSGLERGARALDEVVAFLPSVDELARALPPEAATWRDAAAAARRAGNLSLAGALELRAAGLPKR